MTEAIPSISDTITIGEQKVKMTYGLMMDLQRVIPNAETAIESVMTDSFIRDYLVRRVLTPIKGTVEKEADLISAEDMDLSMDEVGQVLDWAVAHLLHFFVKSALALKAQGQMLKALDPSRQLTPGSEL